MNSLLRHDVFEKNLELLKQKNALAAYQIELVYEPHHIQLYETGEKELNLGKQRYGITQFYHNPQGAMQEAQSIVQADFNPKTAVLFFYGLGLAYIYEALQGWLKENAEHHLVFLEDDLEVIYYFLYTDQATTLLQDHQVTLFYFRDINEQAENFYILNSRFINVKTQFLALPYYIMHKKKEAIAVCYRILYDQSWITQVHNELLSGQQGYLLNFYPNFLQLPSSYLSTGLYGKFEGIPAIICGAGPSLDKNIELVKTLTDRALIFAGGSALNAVNAYGLHPHFGVGIDPNPEQYHRWLTNQAFSTPIFYRNRLSHEAFQMIQGPKIYVPGSPQHLATWFEKQLGIDAPNLEEGHNVINFCIEIATFMGCNPIILVGMDLAFTEVKTYASGIQTHPLWLGISNPYNRPQEEIARKDINGKPITTKWDWISEANWIGNYARTHPKLKILNATEGGLGFSFVDNIKLSDVANTFLTRTFDLAGHVHAEIQNSHLTVTHHQIINLVNEVKQSLSQCMQYCAQIIEEENKQLMLPSASTYTAKAILYETLLHEEIIFTTFLNEFERAKNALDQLKGIDNPILQVIESYQFLQSVLAQHETILQKSMMKFIFTPSFAFSKEPTSLPVIAPIPYQFENDELLINDVELQIKAKIKTEKRIEHYANGSIKMEQFRDEAGLLQGPSRFFSNEGTLLGENWFWQGKKQGQSRSFYQSGQLYAIQRYVDDQLHGIQEFFFKEGSLQMRLNYHHGLLEGKVSIYNKNETLIRELTYADGKRHGTEKMWNEAGTCILECEYQQGTPIGSAHEWSGNGTLRKEVFIRQFPTDFDSSSWNVWGQLEQSFKKGLEDFSPFYLEKQKQVAILGDALKMLQERLNALLNENTEQMTPAMQQELEEAKASIAKLQEMEKELNQMQTDYLTNQEAISQDLS
jgi:antitoxin component YwqK of YwqJK toxin-antitoxin module